MKKIYFFYENLIYEVDNNKDTEVKIFENFDEMEEDSILIYVTNEVNQTIENEKEIYYYAKENFSEEEYDDTNFILSTFEKKINLQVLNGTINENKEILDKKKIKIYSIIDFLVGYLPKKEILLENNLSNLFLINLKNNYYLVFAIDGKFLTSFFILEENEIHNTISSLVFSKQKQEMISILNVEQSILDEKQHIIENIDKYFKIENIKTYFNNNAILDVISKKFETYLINELRISPLISYIEKNYKKIKTKIVNLSVFMSKIKKENTIKLSLLGIIFMAFVGINYYINNILKEEVIENFENKIEMLNNQLKQVQNLKLKEEAKRIYDILDKKTNKSDKETLILPYLITYLSHFNLEIKDAEVIYDEKRNKYYAFIKVSGLLSNDLLNKFSKLIGLEGLDIVPTQNVIKKGFLYVLTFDMEKIYKKMKKEKLVNIK